MLLWFERGWLLQVAYLAFILMVTAKSLKLQGQNEWMHKNKGRVWDWTLDTHLHTYMHAHILAALKFYSHVWINMILADKEPVSREGWFHVLCIAVLSILRMYFYKFHICLPNITGDVIFVLAFSPPQQPLLPQPFPKGSGQQLERKKRKNLQENGTWVWQITSAKVTHLLRSWQWP